MLLNCPHEIHGTVARLAQRPLQALLLELRHVLCRHQQRNGERDGEPKIFHC